MIISEPIMESDTVALLWPCLASSPNCTRPERDPTSRNMSRERDRNTTSDMLVNVSLYTLDGGSTFLIIVLSVIVLLAVVFTFSRLFVKAEAMGKAEVVGEVKFEGGEGMFCLDGDEWPS